MAIKERQATRDIADVVLGDAHNYAFYRLLEHLHRLHDDDLESGEADSPLFQRVVLEGDAQLGFPASDVVLAERLPDSDEQYRVKTSFFSMQGPDSPLPGYYIDQLAYDYAHGIGIRPAFLDFFNHRLLTLLHQAWRKYRYYVRFQHEAKDRFSKYVFALIGLNDSELRGTTPIPWARLLSFTGIIASRSRSPSVVSGIIAHCFDLEAVHIREFDQRYVDVAPGQRNAMGKANATLGDNFVLGARVSTRASKFTIVISELTQERFRDFLPNGKDYEPLRKLIDFLLRDSMAYDLELGLQQKEVPPFVLKKESGTHLGWTTFLPQDAPLRLESVVKIKART